MFIKVLLVLVLVSVVLALFSLRTLNAKKEISEVKSKLKKGRVVFLSADRQDQSSASSSEE